MDLAAVMGLMIEPVRQGQCQWLLELLRCGYPLIGDGPRNAVVGKTVHKRNNAAVLGFPGRTQRVERFGAGHVEPVFALPAHRVAYADAVGNGHLRVTLAADGGATVRAMAFRAAASDLGAAITARRGGTLHVAGTLSVDQWQGERRVSFRILDVAEPRDL